MSRPSKPLFAPSFGPLSLAGGWEDESPSVVAKQRMGEDPAGQFGRDPELIWKIRVVGELKFARPPLSGD
jgi:hypothetical protein